MSKASFGAMVLAAILLSGCLRGHSWEDFFGAEDATADGAGGGEGVRIVRGFPVVVAGATASSSGAGGGGGTASVGSGGWDGGEVDAGSDAAPLDAATEAGVCGGDVCEVGPARSASCVCAPSDPSCACVALICENAPECCALMFLGDGGWGPGGQGEWSAGCVAKVPGYCGLCADAG
jgi:hypothetical protein